MQPTGAGGRIRHARIARGMTQAELADAVGVSRSAVAQWETDRAGQVTANLTRIAEVLGVPPGRLLGEALAAAEEPADSTELAMLRLYRECDEADRQLLLQTALRLVRRRRNPE